MCSKVQVCSDNFRLYLVVNTTLVASDIYCCDLYASFLNFAAESLFDCSINPLADVGQRQEGDRQKVISLDEVDVAIQGEQSSLQGELISHHRPVWAEVKTEKSLGF